jgi:hypothetical protein
VLGDSGYKSLGVDCGDTTHSCSVNCDDVSDVYAWRCNTNTSCNCFKKCPQFDTYVVRGVNSIGDLCYRRSPPSCQPTLAAIMAPTIDQGNCACKCVDQNLTLFQNGTRFGCGRPESVCSDSSECGGPLQGACPLSFPNQCKCFNPWGGPKCQQHMCPLCENTAFCSTSASQPCICTGQWMGTYCNISKPITPSRPDLPGNVERCNATSYAVVPYFPPTQVSPPCPSECAYCTSDTDGTPVCVYILPDFDTTIRTGCPETHRCVFLIGQYHFGYIDCFGPYPCDLISQDYAAVYFNCTSPIGCTIHCSDILNSEGAVQDRSSLRCTAPNGSCSCSSQNCPGWVTCEPGLTCNGDPCANKYCSDSMVVYNQTAGTCSCKCPVGRWTASDENCYALEDNPCTLSCVNGVCHDGRCWCGIGYYGDDCSLRDDTVALATTSDCPFPCTFCSRGSCIIESFEADEVRCPLGWACIFVCGRFCTGAAKNLVCPQGSGPCELWCWQAVQIVNGFFPFLPFPGELRPFSACTKSQLICEDPEKGCQARCGNNTLARTSSPYYHARTVRNIICNGTAVNSSSLTVPPNGCGTSSCLIAEYDTCYKEGNFSEELSFYGFIRTCPIDRAGQWLIPYVDNRTNTCECSCGDGFEFVNSTCSAVGCTPKCQNLGVCQVAANSTGFVCKCFGGWNGKDCTSRCFFPVTANVTQCENGFYVIDGQLVVPGNASVDLYRDIPDLQRLKVNGSVTANSTLSIAPYNISGVNFQPIVTVSGNWVQTGGTTLQNAVIFDPSKGTFIATLLSINGAAQFSNSSLEVALNGAELVKWLKLRKESFTLTLITFGNLSGEFAAINFKQLVSGDDCEKLVNRTSYNQGSLTVVFSLDSSACTPSIDGLVSTNGLAIGLGVTAAILVVGALVVVMAVPSVRAKVFPYFKSRGESTKADDTELQETPTAQPDRGTWMRSSPRS